VDPEVAGSKPVIHPMSCPDFLRLLRHLAGGLGCPVRRLCHFCAPRPRLIQDGNPCPEALRMVVRIPRDHGERLPPPQFLHRIEIRTVLHQPGMPQVMEPHVREADLSATTVRSLHMRRLSLALMTHGGHCVYFSC
jgi:hypothetical protein